MVDVNLNDYRELYNSTAKKYLTILKQFVAKKQGNLDEFYLKEAHRAAHSLKSQSLVMGYNQLGQLCKNIEFFMKTKLDQQTALSVHQMARLTDLVKTIEQSLETIEKTGQELTIAEDIAELISNID